MDDYLYQMEPVFDGDDMAAVADCVRSTWLLEGRRTAAFEQALAAYVGARYAVAVPSGTVAMALSLMALGVGHGDEVIVPDLTFVATANAVSLAGATPVLVDVRPGRLGLDVAQMRPAITARTRAVLPVWLNGRDPGMRAIVRVADEYGLPVVEDAACALGSWSQGQHAGTFGRAGCISFNTTKIITTGSGGMVVTDDEALAERLRRLKNHGRLDRRDYHPSIGFNFSFTELLAALGLSQLDKLAERVAHKRLLCEWYYQRLEEVDEIVLQRPAPGISPWYPDIFVAEAQALQDHLENRQIQTRRYYPPLHTQPCYQARGEFDNAQAAASQGLWLPAAAYVDEEIVDRVCREIKAGL